MDIQHTKGQIDKTDIYQTLKDHFGFDAFRSGQEEVITTLLNGESAAAIFPTGSGKSLCYQLPALLLPGLTLVISPLIALMKDQIDSLKKQGISAERLDSSLDADSYRNAINNIRTGQLKILFVAPERMSNERFLSIIKDQQLSLLAVDEAHCISAWGHNFRPDYLKLARAAKELCVERVLALTATATPQVSTDIAEAFDIKDQNVINTGFYRPNLEMRVIACSNSERPALLIKRLRKRPPGSTIVYVSLQRDAETAAQNLRDNGFNARAYHAGMSAENRAAVQDGFMDNSIEIICATIAFGMGIDKANIRYIYHYHLPKGFESYMQEIGRAGRDGKPSVCELFACADDCTTLENFVYGDTPDAGSIVDIVNAILDQGEEIDVSTYELSRKHDMRTLVVNTLLTRLELMEIIRSEGFYYSNIRLAPALSNDEILSHYNENQASFLRKMFSCCTMAKKWSTLDTDQAVITTGHTRSVILRALEDLENKGFVELQLGGYRQRFRRLNENVNRQEVCTHLQTTFLKHEQMEIRRIQNMLDYAQHDGCLTGYLLNYFGETLDKCGHCGICLGDSPASVKKRVNEEIKNHTIENLSALIKEYPNALSQPRQQARFLCGLNSPAVSAAKSLRGNPAFGSLAQVPFANVLKYCTSTLKLDD
ncbi:MAG: ATP-dependent DNA helicase RecQ [Desulforhopalus sp.]|jgi:ATP-dependent DNA helicase RecQ